jgi:hypothetical protein
MVETVMTESEFSSRIPVEFRIESVCTLNGELRTVLAPRTVGRILSLLPIDSRLHLWSQEAYFGIGARIGLEKAVTQCKCGDLAYWPQGDAICLFFRDMMPLSKVNPIGRISTSALERVFERIKTGVMIRFSRS